MFSLLHLVYLAWSTLSLLILSRLLVSALSPFVFRQKSYHCDGWTLRDSDSGDDEFGLNPGKVREYQDRLRSHHGTPSWLQPSRPSHWSLHRSRSTARAAFPSSSQSPSGHARSKVAPRRSAPASSAAREASSSARARARPKQKEKQPARPRDRKPRGRSLSNRSEPRHPDNPNTTRQ